MAWSCVEDGGGHVLRMEDGHVLRMEEGHVFRMEDGHVLCYGVVTC